jgi:selenide,water dikinase
VRERVVAVEEGALRLGSGTRLACHRPLIATGVQAPDWLQGSGLALCGQGFVQTTATLQSPSNPEVFAAGDVATPAGRPRPRSGVYAVRAGAPLAANLRRFLEGAPLAPYQAPSRTLNLLSCGDRTAIATWGRWSAQGAWAWRWKDRIDRAFIARFTVAIRAA